MWFERWDRRHGPGRGMGGGSGPDSKQARQLRQRCGGPNEAVSWDVGWGRRRVRGGSRGPRPAGARLDIGCSVAASARSGASGDGRAGRHRGLDDRCGGVLVGGDAASVSSMVCGGGHGLGWVGAGNHARARRSIHGLLGGRRRGLHRSRSAPAWLDSNRRTGSAVSWALDWGWGRAVCMGRGGCGGCLRRGRGLTGVGGGRRRLAGRGGAEPRHLERRGVARGLPGGAQQVRAGDV